MLAAALSVLVALQAVPPAHSTTLYSDSVTVVGTDQAWPYSLYHSDEASTGRGGADGLVRWVRVDDPYGGSVSIPATYLFALVEDIRAFTETRESKSVLYLSRAVTLGAVLLAFGLVIVVPPLWLGLRLRRHRRQARRTRASLGAGRESERLRIAQDLHDGPVQDLQVVRLRLAALLRRGAETDAQADALRTVADDVHRVIRELRHTSEDLRPPALGPFGLAAALDTLADRAGSAHSHVQISTALDDDGQTLAEPVRLALYRIAQEAVTNALRHAGPERVTVSLRLDGASVELTVDDDGSGFDATASLPTGRYGLVGMRERAEAVGAVLEVAPRPGGGTRVRVTA